MKILFLDIDGVLNYRAVFLRGSGGAPICPLAFGRLKKLIAETGAKVVLSSTWRLGEGTRHQDKLREVGVMSMTHEDWRTVQLPVEYGDKPSIIVNWPKRGDEIAEWLSRHPEVTVYAIVDDDSDMLPWQPFRAN